MKYSNSCPAFGSTGATSVCFQVLFVSDYIKFYCLCSFHITGAWWPWKGSPLSTFSGLSSFS